MKLPLKKLYQTRHAKGGDAGLIKIKKIKMTEPKIRILAIVGMMALAYIAFMVLFHLADPR